MSHLRFDSAYKPRRRWVRLLSSPCLIMLVTIITDDINAINSNVRQQNCVRNYLSTYSPFLLQTRYVPYVALSAYSRASNYSL